MEFDFESELARVLPMLRGYSQRFATAGMDPEDFLQETAIRALANKDSFQPGTNFKGWLSVIMYNYFLSLKRRDWRQLELEQGFAESIPIAANAHDKVELAETLLALSELKENRARLFRMVVLDGMTYEEVAEQEGMAVGTIKSQVSRARSALRERAGLSREEDE